MPNYTKLAQDLLPKDELALTRQAAKPAILALSDDELMALAASLQVARAQAGEPARSGPKNRANVLGAALQRAHAERRRRGLKPAAPPAGTAAKPATKRKAASGKSATPASSTRLVGGRKAVAGLKPDTRTTAHRVKKAKPAKAEVDMPDTTEKPAKKARPAASSATAIAARPAKQQADKDDEKAARKAAKQAERDARKAEKQATRAAEKATAKAERKAAKKKAGKSADADRKTGDAGKKKKGKPAKSKT